MGQREVLTVHAFFRPVMTQYVFLEDTILFIFYYISLSQELKFLIFSDFFNLLSATQPFQKIKICKSFWKRKMWVFQVIRYSYWYLATIPVSMGDFFHKLCKLTYYGKTTLDLNSIGIFFIKSTIIITIFIFRGHKCFKEKISWHNIHWATSKGLCRNGVKITNLQTLLTLPKRAFQWQKIELQY